MAKEEDVTFEEVLLERERLYGLAAMLNGKLGNAQMAAENDEMAHAMRRERIHRFGMRFDADAQVVAQDIIESVEKQNG